MDIDTNLRDWKYENQEIQQKVGDCKTQLKGKDVDAILQIILQSTGPKIDDVGSALERIHYRHGDCPQDYYGNEQMESAGEDRTASSSAEMAAIEE